MVILTNVSITSLHFLLHLLQLLYHMLLLILLLFLMDIKLTRNKLHHKLVFISKMYIILFILSDNTNNRS